MFSVFRRRSTITIDCFTTDPFVYEYSPIVRGTRCYPEWWKTLPQSGSTIDQDFNIQTNMKNCYGFIELHKQSFVLRCWSDILFSVTENEGYKYKFLRGNTTLGEHTPQQYNHAFSNFYHAKLLSPWFIREKTGIHFAYVANHWHNEHVDYMLPNAIVRYDWQGTTNVNMFIPKKNFTFTMNINQPLIHIVPLTEKKVISKCHLIDEKEYERIFINVSRTFGGFTRAIKVLRKEKDEQKMGKCPFGFGRK